MMQKKIMTKGNELAACDPVVVSVATSLARFFGHFENTTPRTGVSITYSPEKQPSVMPSCSRNLKELFHGLGDCAIDTVDLRNKKARFHQACFWDPTMGGSRGSSVSIEGLRARSLGIRVQGLRFRV